MIVNTVHFNQNPASTAAGFSPMGIKERQERDREAVRRSILDAARDLFVTEGYQNVSIRKIAEGIEYSPAAIYGYFPSKDDIFFALAEEGFCLLHGPAAERPAGVAPIERVYEMFWHFYQFSHDHPQYFALMFVDRSVPSIRQVYERFAFAREVKQSLIAELQRCIDEAVFSPAVTAPVAFRLLMTPLIGVATLRLSDRLSPDEDPDDLARDLLDLTIAGLRSGVTLRSHGFGCVTDETVPVKASQQESSR
jgi:AcrR family transcriptional regulator